MAIELLELTPQERDRAEQFKWSTSLDGSVLLQRETFRAQNAYSAWVSVYFALAIGGPMPRIGEEAEQVAASWLALMGLPAERSSADRRLAWETWRTTTHALWELYRPAYDPTLFALANRWLTAPYERRFRMMWESLGQKPRPPVPAIPTDVVVTPETAWLRHRMLMTLLAHPRAAYLEADEVALIADYHHWLGISPPLPRSRQAAWGLLYAVHAALREALDQTGEDACQVWDEYVAEVLLSGTRDYDAFPFPIPDA